jgi:hypothetical protein
MCWTEKLKEGKFDQIYVCTYSNAEIVTGIICRICMSEIDNFIVLSLKCFILRIA